MILQQVFRQTLAIATIALNQLHSGVGDGWVAPTLEKLQKAGPSDQLHFTISDSSWVASVEHIGSIFGSCICACLLDVLGRKCMAASCAISIFLVWLGTALADTIWLIICMRFMFGLACGINFSMDTTYLAEVSSPSYRGVLGTIVLSLYYLGLFVENTIATYLSYRLTAAVNVCLAFVSVVSVLFMVESPQYLFLRGRDADAERAFRYLQGGATCRTLEGDGELDRIKKNVQFEKTKKSSYAKMLTSSVNYRSVLIVVLVQTLCDATGFTPILSYSSLIFSSTEIFTQNEFTILLGLSQFLFSIVSIWLINRYNRRSLLLVSFAVMTITQISTAVLFFVHQRLVPVPYFSWCIFITVTAYIGVMALAYPAIFALRGELLPLSIKAFAGFAVILVNSACNFVLNMIFLYISEGYGMYANFLVYSVASVIIFVFLYLYVPETRNKSLTEIQDVLHQRYIEPCAT